MTTVEHRVHIDRAHIPFRQNLDKGAVVEFPPNGRDSSHDDPTPAVAAVKFRGRNLGARPSHVPMSLFRLRGMTSRWRLVVR
jgi:hypothetical protein